MPIGLLSMHTTNFILAVTVYTFAYKRSSHDKVMARRLVSFTCQYISLCAVYHSIININKYICTCW